jgi:hypothetical protein
MPERWSQPWVSAAMNERSESNPPPFRRRVGRLLGGAVKISGRRQNLLPRDADARRRLDADANALASEFNDPDANVVSNPQHFAGLPGQHQHRAHLHDGISKRPGGQFTADMMVRGRERRDKSILFD